MIKPIKYFFEAFFVYLSFLIAKLIGLSLTRKFFSLIFKKIGTIIRSNNIINKNLLNFSNKLSDQKKREIISNMWSNYGMTFIEYIFLSNFKKRQSHIILKEKIYYSKYLKIINQLYLYQDTLQTLN